MSFDKLSLAELNKFIADNVKWGVFVQLYCTKVALYIVVWYLPKTMKYKKKYSNEGGPACEGTDHLPLIVYKSSHSVQSFGCDLGVRMAGGVCIVFQYLCVCQYTSD